MLLFQFPSAFLSITLYSISSLPLDRSELVHRKCLDEEMDSFQFTLLSLLQRWMAVVFVPFDKNVQEMCRAHILCIRLKHASEHKQRAKKFSLPSLSSSSLSRAAISACKKEVEGAFTWTESTSLKHLCVLPFQKPKDCIPHSSAHVNKNPSPPSRYIKFKYYSK